MNFLAAFQVWCFERDVCCTGISMSGLIDFSNRRLIGSAALKLVMVRVTGETEQLKKSRRIASAFKILTTALPLMT
jgi:hypothetical protein